MHFNAFVDMVQNYLHSVSSADQIKRKGQNSVCFALCDGS